MTVISAGVGHSRATGATEAGRAAAEEARTAAADGRGEALAIAFAFASSEYDQEALLGAIEGALACPVVGSSTAGEIAGDESYTESVVVLALAGDVTVGVGTADLVDGESERAGSEAATVALDDLGRDPLPARLLASVGSDGEVVDDDDGDGGDVDEGWTANAVATTVLGDGLYGDPEGALDGVGDVLGSTPVAGAWAGDDWKYESTWTYVDGAPRQDAMAVTMLDAGVRTGVGSATGLTTSGHEFTVTDAADRVVYELDGRPALDVYRDAFGDAVDSFQFLLTKPMGYDLGGDEPSVFVPGPSPFEDDPDTALHVTGPIEEGWTVSVLDTSREAVLSGTERAVEAALADAGHPDDVAAVLVYDCMCRWYHLSDAETRAAEARIVQDAVGEDVPVAGFYSYGEVHAPGPMAGARNQSIVVQVVTNEALPTVGGGAEAGSDRTSDRP